MSNDLLITPASRKLELKDSSGNVDAVIQTDGSGNLSITNAGGSITIGTADTNLNMPGNLVITGNINQANITDLDVTDKTITLGAGQTNAQADSSGIKIDGSNASLLWSTTDNRFTMNENLRVEGDSSSGNAFEVTKGETNAQSFRVQNTGEVVVSGDYLYASHTGNAFYAQGAAYFRTSIANDQGDLVIADNLQVGTTSTAAHTRFFMGNNAVTADDTGVRFTPAGTYSDVRYEHRFRKRDEGGGIPLYIDRTEGTAGSHTQTHRFGTYTNHSEQFEVYGNMRADIGTFTGDKTSTLSTLNLLAETNGAGAGIAFSDNGTPPTTTPDLSSAQRGHLTFYHGDSQSFGSGASFRFETSETTLSVLADGKLLYKTGLYVKPSSGTGAGTLVIDSSRNITATTGAFSGKVAVMSSAVHNNFDFYNNGTTYLNGAVTLDDAVNITGSNRKLMMNSNEVITASGSLKAYDALFVGSDTGSVQAPKKILELSSNSSNTERGPWNPIVSSIRNSGRRLYPDEDFADGANEVAVYNNAGGGVVTITREDATTNSGGAAPNSSGKVLRINHNGGTSSPGFGGFRLTIPSEDNHTFVQIFQAKLDAGRELIIAENAQGSNSRSYFITDNAGTGKWEWYARVSHCGNSGSFSSGGHIYVAGGSGNFNWYLASCTVYDVTESYYGQINVGNGSDSDSKVIINKADGTSDHIQFIHAGTRTGEIGSTDTTWLRINQETSKNIYTPRYIRADSGFFIDSTSKGIDGNGFAKGLTGVTSSGTITFSGLSASTTETTGVLINGSNQLVTREFGSNAFNSTAFLTSETDTLDTVCDRNSTTNQTITAGALIGESYVRTGGTGKVALTVNDGQGNANVTFNHQNGVPDTAGNCFRIVTNVDAQSSPQMNIEMVANNTTGSSVNTPSAMEIEPTVVDIPYQLRHMGDTNTHLQFDADRIRLTAGGTVKFDSNNTYLTSAVTSIAGTANEIDVSASTGAVTVGIVGNPTLTGNVGITGDLTVSGNQIYTNNVASRNKLHVWNSSHYAIGMINGITGGGINNDYAMTFQMNDDNDRGFWFGDSSMALSSHAMTITTQGRVNIASGLRVGFGEADTTQEGASGIHVNGLLDVDDGIIALSGNSNAIQQTGASLLLGDCNENDDVTVLRLKVTGADALVFNDSDATFGGNLFVPQYIYHSGDTNSYMRFPAADDFQIVAGGRELVRLDEGSTDIAKFMTDEFRMYQDGNFHADADVFAFSTSTGSDIRLKENVRPLENCLEKVLKLDGVIFDWKKDNRGINQYGFIAQQVEEHVPDLVKEVQGFEDEGQIKALNYEGVIPMLVEAMKEQQNIINRLEERIKILEGENSGDK